MRKQNIESAIGRRQLSGILCWWGIVLALGLIAGRSHWILNETFLGHNLFKEWWNVMRVTKIATFGFCFPCLLAWVIGRCSHIRCTRPLAALVVLCFGLANVAIVVYYRFIGDLFPASRLRDVAQLVSIRDQLLWQVLGPFDYLALVATLAVAWLCWRRHPDAVQVAGRSRHRSASTMAIIALLVYGTLLTAQIRRHGWPGTKLTQHGAVMTASHYGFLAAYAATAFRDALPPPAAVPYPGTVNPELTPATAPGPIGLANVILLQVESLDALAIDAEVAGRPVMPFLRGLAATSIRARHAFAQHAGGGSSDAELATLLSLLPLVSHSGLRTAQYDRIDSLPAVLRAAGYTTLFMHPNSGHFYNRDWAYRNLPVDAFLDARSFNGDAQGWYATDHAFMTQALDHLVSIRQPLCAYLITLQSHGPFRNHAPEGSSDLDFSRGGHYSTIEKHYLQCLHEVDRALAAFLTALPVRLNTDNNLVFIFGDHSSGVLDRPADKREPITLLFHHPRLTSRHLGEPVSHLDIAPTITRLLGLAGGATWLGDDMLALGSRRVTLPNSAILTLGSATNTIKHVRGAGTPYADYSASLLQGGQAQ